MSVTNSRRIALTRPAVDYEMYGPLNSDVYKAHKAAGTDRAAAIRCDCGDPFEFVERAEQLRDAHGRKVEAISIIQSFESSELDPRVPAYVQQINDLGYELGKRLAPNSDVLVITHTDSSGGHGHNHIKVMNHDNVTGGALRRDVRHFAVAEVNDELMREHSMRVVETGSRDQTKYWEHVREGATIAAFDKLLGDRLMEVRLDQGWTDQAGYEAALEAVGIEIKEERYVIAASSDGSIPEHEIIGWTYRMLDDTRVDVGVRPRVRRRKASSLGDEFTHKSVQAQIEVRQAQRAAQQAAQPTLSAVQAEWLERISQSYDSAFDARLAMTKAGVELADQNAVMGAWEQAKTPVSGSAVLEQHDQLETAENGAGTPENATLGQSNYSPDDAKPILDPEVGRKWVENGREMGAADLTENSDSLVDEQTGSRSDSATSRTPDVGPILATSGRDMATIGRTLGTASDHEAELELLELRYRIVTEGASWTDDEAFRTRVRIELLKEDLGIPDDAPEPTQPDQQQGAEPSSPPGSSGPSPLAPTSVDVEQIDETVPSSPPGSSGPSPAPPGLVDAGSPSTPASVNPTAPYRSGVWELADAAKNAKVKASLEAIARFDEDARVRLAAGERIGHREVPKGIGQQWLDAHRDRLDPVAHHEMKLRAERMVERSAEFEVGKALKEKLDALAKRGDFVTDEYRDTEQRLGDSNAQRRLIEQRMNAGIYEQDSKWRPGQPVPSRQHSKAMTQRLHQLAEGALAEQVELEAQRDQQLGG